MTTRPALAIAAGIILAVFFTAGLLAPVLAPYDLEAMDLTARLLMPFESAAHILGTDELGRDIFSRLLYSIRMSFVLADVGTLLGVVIGAFVSSGIVIAKMIGLGMLVAVLLAATVVRGLLLPRLSLAEQSAIRNPRITFQ